MIHDLLRARVPAPPQGPFALARASSVGPAGRCVHGYMVKKSSRSGQVKLYRRKKPPTAPGDIFVPGDWCRHRGRYPHRPLVCSSAQKKEYVTVPAAAFPLQESHQARSAWIYLFRRIAQRRTVFIRKAKTSQTVLRIVPITAPSWLESQLWGGLGRSPREA